MIFSLRTSVLRVGRWGTIGSLALLFALSMHSPLALAATGPQGPCGSSITVDNTPAGASAQCDMGISATFSEGTLSFTNDANATTSPVVTGTNSYSFHTTIIDQRNITAGWRLEASSTGMTNTVNNVTTTIPLSITNSSATCTPTVPGQNTCVTPTCYAVGQLTSTPQYFLSSGQGTLISGTFQATTNGSYTFSGAEPTGTYTGTIRISLVNAF